MPGVLGVEPLDGQVQAHGHAARPIEGIIHDHPTVDDEEDAPGRGEREAQGLAFGLGGQSEDADIQTGGFSRRGGQRDRLRPGVGAVGQDPFGQGRLPGEGGLVPQGLEEGGEVGAVRAPMVGPGSVMAAPLGQRPAQAVAAETAGADQDRTSHRFVENQQGVTVVHPPAVGFAGQGRVGRGVCLEGRVPPSGGRRARPAVQKRWVGQAARSPARSRVPAAD